MHKYEASVGRYKKNSVTKKTALQFYKLKENYNSNKQKKHW